VTNKRNERATSLQVKFSKCFLTTVEDELRHGLTATGWWSFNREKLKKSTVDFWILALHSLFYKEVQFIIVKPSELLKKLEAIHGNARVYQCYFTVTKKKKCWETRGVSREERVLISANSYKSLMRDFSEHLNKWEKLRFRER
jgi:hypothetical protein